MKHNYFKAGIHVLLLMLVALVCTVQVQAQIITTFAGNGVAGYGGDDGSAISARLDMPRSVAVDSVGSIYIADYYNHRIRKVYLNGMITTVAGTGEAGYSGDGGAAINAQIAGPTGIAVDRAGNVYIADNGNSRIRKIDTNGIITTVAGTGTHSYGGDGGAAINAHLHSPFDVAIDRSYNIYIADFNNHRIRKVDTNGIMTTVAGTGAYGYSGDGGAATNAQLYEPKGIWIDGLGNLYIADTENQRIRKVDSNGIITTIAGTGTHGFSGDGGSSTSAQVYYPNDITTDVLGNIYIADSDNNRVRMINSNGIITTVAGSGVSGFGGDNDLAINANLYLPTGIALYNNNLYIADIYNHRVRKVSDIISSNANLSSLTLSTGTLSPTFASGTLSYTASVSNNISSITVTPAAEDSAASITVNGSAITSGQASQSIALNEGSNIINAVVTAQNGSTQTYTINVSREANIIAGGIITTIAGTGVWGYSGDGSAATNARIANPQGVTVDKWGNIYIADYSNHRIRKVDIHGNITTVAGTGTGGYSGDEGPATSARINQPVGITVDNAGNIYFTEWGNNRARKVNLNGVITTIAGTGEMDYSGDGGAATNATFRLPTGIAVDSLGNIYITDSNNMRVRKISSNGVITTIAGTGVSGFSGDGGLATSARLNEPTGVAVDASGNIYIADQQNLRVRKVDTNGIITTIAGNGMEGFGGDGGPATSANLFFAGSVATDRFGNVYIGDQGSYRVRKVDSNGIISTVAGVPGGGSGDIGDGGPAVNALLDYPASMALDEAGNLYISDRYHQRIRKVSSSLSSNANLSALTLSTGTLAPAFASGTLNYTATVANSVSSIFITPTVDQATATVTVNGGATNSGSASQSIALSEGSNIINIVVTAQNGTTQTYTITISREANTVSELIIRTIAGTGEEGYSGDGGLAVNAQIGYSRGTTVDGQGNIYIADASNSRIRKINTQGIITTVAGSGGQGYYGDGGPATNASLNSPQGVAVDRNGNIYIADSQNFRIRKVVTHGTISTVAGNGIQGYSGDEGLATNASINYIYGIAVDGSGNIYFSDGIRIRKVDTNGIITTVAGNGTQGYSGDGGLAINAQIDNVHGLTVDGLGNIYLADAHNNRIRKVNTDGIITTLIGTGEAGYSGDGSNALNAQLSYPTGISIDNSGNIFIADRGNNRIRKVDINKIITTVAGTGEYTFSGDGGIAISAGLRHPINVAADNLNNLYIADYYNLRIRKVSSQASSNANLSSLTLSAGTLSPAFASDTLNYTATVANTVSFISLTLTAAHNAATITVNGNAAANGNASYDVPLEIGNNTIIIEVTAQDGNTTQSYTLEVNRAENTAPVLATIGDKIVNEGENVNFTASATDGDSSQVLRYSLIDAPTGASIDTATGVFHWTPTLAQNASSHTFTIRVTDSGAPVLIAEEEITVSFVNPYNTINSGSITPTADLQTISTESGSYYTFSAVAGTEYMFSFCPEAGGTYSDDPVLILTTANNNEIAYNNDYCEYGSHISWTCLQSGTYKIHHQNFEQASTVVSRELAYKIVAVHNMAPELASIGNKTINELETLTFVASATDEDEPAQTLTFSLGEGAPGGASIDAVTGEFNWTPTEAQGPQTYTFAIQVSDDGTPALATEEVITVTVNEVNVAPVLATIGNQTVDELTQLSFTASATDSDLPANTLTYSLSGAPLSASIDASTGAFTWTPTEAQGPGEFTFTVKVSDGALETEETIMVTVAEVNTAPVLATINDTILYEGNSLNFTANATDNDYPLNTLTFSLVDAPTGAAINSSTGEFNWTPASAQSGLSYTFTVRVTDNGSPVLFAEDQITVSITNNYGTVKGDSIIPTDSIQTILTQSGTYHEFYAEAGQTYIFSFCESNGGSYTGDPVLILTNSQNHDIYYSDDYCSYGSHIVWTCNNSGTYRIQHRNFGSSSDVITRTLAYKILVNRPPVLAAIGNKTVDEQNSLAFTVSATDDGQPYGYLSYYLDGAPDGAWIDSYSGNFNWTPSEYQGGSTYTFIVKVTDGTLTAEEEISVTVNKVNNRPLLSWIGNQRVDEGGNSTLSFTAYGYDYDIPVDTLYYSLIGAPEGAYIDSISGAFSWTPTLEQGTSSHTFIVRVTDSGEPALYAEEQITVTIGNQYGTIRADSLIPTTTLQTVSSNSGTYHEFYAVAGREYTFSFCADQGGSYSGDPTLLITNTSNNYISYNDDYCGLGSNLVWTCYSTGTYRIHHRNYGGYTGIQTRTLAYRISSMNNHAPVLAAIGNKTVDELTELNFTATATDDNATEQALVFSLSGAPEGASIDAATGVFSWTPTEAQGPATYKFNVNVSDGQLSDSEEITVTVSEVNLAPVLTAIGNKSVNEQTTLTFRASATDSDLPVDTLVYSLIGAPQGAAIDRATGEFRWSPTEAQDGTHTFTVKVSDGKLATEEEITVTVNEVNVAPDLIAIGDKTVDERTTLAFKASATDVDLPANTLRYTLVGAPQGATLDRVTGEFSWTPGEAQGGREFTFTVKVTDNGSPALSDEETITVTVNEVNEAPILAEMSDKTVDEHTTLAFTVSATDGDLPAQTLRYSLIDAPEGASINASTGVFTWTPFETQDGIHSFTVKVSDGELTDEKQITVTVKEVNEAPVLTAISTQMIDEHAVLTFTVTATDADLPANTLSYSLVGAPEGAVLDSTSGEFTWTPTEAQGPATYTFKIKVTDNGSPALSDEETITVTVNEVNEAPVLAEIGNKEVDEHATLSFTASATDADLPANTLTFILVGAPAGATITTTGQFSWTPTEAQDGTHTFTVKVSDGELSAEEEITVTVNEVNQAPIIVSVPDTTVMADSLYSYHIIATDADLPANTLTYTASTLPTWLSFDSTTMVLSGRPDNSQIGEHQVKLIVSDGLIAVEQQYLITVSTTTSARAKDLRKNQVLVFPNPTAGQVSISISHITSAKEMVLRLTSVEGRTMLDTTGPLEMVNKQLNDHLSDAPAGMYVLQLVVDIERHLVKIVKQ